MSRRKNKNEMFKVRMNELAFHGVDVRGEHHEFKSTQDFANFLEVSRPALTSWLKGDRSPDMDMLVHLSNKLNMSIDYLVGLSENNSLDADIQAVARYTGLSESSISAINDDRFQAEMGTFLTGLAKHPSFDGIANSFMYAHHLASDVTDDKDDLLQERLDYFGKNPFVIVVDKTITQRMHEFCDSMSNYFKEYAYHYFDYIADISSRTVVEEIAPEEIKTIESHDDREVK